MRGVVFIIWIAGVKDAKTTTGRWTGVLIANGETGFPRAAAGRVKVTLTTEGRKYFERELADHVKVVTVTEVGGFSAPPEGDRLSGGSEFRQQIELRKSVRLFSK